MRELLLALPRGQWRWLLLAAALAGAGLVASGFFLPWFSQWFTDHYLNSRQRGWLGGLLLAMALAALLRAALTWLQRHLLLRIQLAAARSLNEATFQALLYTDAQRLAQTAPGSSGYLLRRQQRALALLYGDIAQGFSDLPAVPVLLLVMLWFDPLLAGLACVLTSLNAIAYVLVSGRRAHLGSSAAGAGARVATLVEHDLARLPALRAAGAETAIENNWLSAYRSQAQATRRLALIGQLLTAVPQTLAGLSVATLLVAGAAQIIDGAISIGTLVACQTLLFSINDAVQRFIEAGRLYPEVVADLQRHKALLALPADIIATETASESVAAPALTGELTISGIHAGIALQLQLPAAALLALPDDGSADAQRLCRALAGLEQPSGLSVRWGDLSLDALNDAQRQASVMLLDGRNTILDDSLRENIRLWDARIGDEEIAQALHLAGFEEALQLPESLDTALGQREFSNGQMRRIVLARALLRQPRLLILDGTLEALDLPLVRLILQRLGQARQSIIITSPRTEVCTLCDYRLHAGSDGWQLQALR